MQRIILVLLFTLPNISLAKSGVDLTVESLIKKNKCDKEMSQLINNWGGSLKSWRELPSSDKSAFYIKPTNQLSKWIEIDLVNKPRLLLHKPESIYEVQFEDDCSKSLATHPQRNYKIKSNGLDDAKLFKKIMALKSGIIYSWSPGMSLSIKGLRDITELAKEKNIPLIIATDPYTTKEQVSKIIRQQKISLKSINYINNLEMHYRRALIHYPNIIVFKNGVIQEGLLPGYASKEMYYSFYEERVLK